ncbi:molybdopterin biosynthesis protein [Salipiger sp. IMCC34102]|uniref:molybdopterin-binding protein n=1 Tax=Salipiger sp. IMCC34102 TaxID=2510647 RepID=UPI00101D202E|nr:molybdopterin-binding protein [Salipiger sp. IMCC34102]RYH02802.1 molybdopterin biosynthesis protein [Salipiger sp. IMCC34102]
MKFGAVPVAAAEGAVLAHSLQAGGGRLRKGRVLDAADVAALARGGHAEVTVARLDPGDLDEDSAATRIARALVPDDTAGIKITTAATGRVNLKAQGPGVVTFDAAAIHALNAVDPMITVATVPQATRVSAGQLIATIKIISFAVAGRLVERACAAVPASAVTLHPPRLSRAVLIETRIGDAAPSPKGREALRKRLSRLDAQLAPRIVVPHETADLARALAGAQGDLIFILTGSATSDIADTAPSAVVSAGGRVIHYGMPVDPGNLLFLGALGARPVIGLPGCARSPALNGADWVLERVICGLPVGPAEIAAMGLGGLLKEIPTRPRPRADG